MALWGQTGGGLNGGRLSRWVGPRLKVNVRHSYPAFLTHFLLRRAIRPRLRRCACSPCSTYCSTLKRPGGLSHMALQDQHPGQTCPVRHAFVGKDSPPTAVLGSSTFPRAELRAPRIHSLLP